MTVPQIYDMTALQQIAAADASVQHIVSNSMQQTQHNNTLSNLQKLDNSIQYMKQVSTNDNPTGLTIYTQSRSTNITPIDNNELLSLPNSRSGTPIDSQPLQHTAATQQLIHNITVLHNRCASYAIGESPSLTPTKHHDKPKRRSGLSVIASPTTSTRALGAAVTSLILAEPGTPLRLMKQLPRVGAIKNDSGNVTPKTPQTQLRLINMKVKAVKKIQQWYRKHIHLRQQQSTELTDIQEDIADLPPSSFAKMSPNQRAKALHTLQSPSMTPNNKLRTLHSRIQSAQSSPVKQRHNNLYNTKSTFSLSTYASPNTSMPGTPVKVHSTKDRSMLNTSENSSTNTSLSKLISITVPSRSPRNTSRIPHKTRALVRGYLVRNIMRQHSTQDLIRQIVDTTRLLKQTRDYAYSHNDTSSAQFAHQLQHQLNGLKLRFADLFTSNRKFVFTNSTTPFTRHSSVANSGTVSPATETQYTAQGVTSNNGVPNNGIATTRRLNFDEIKSGSSTPSLSPMLSDLSTGTATLQPIDLGHNNTTRPLTNYRKGTAATTRLSSRRLSTVNSNLIRARSNSSSPDRGISLHSSHDTNSFIDIHNNTEHNKHNTTTHESAGQLLISRELVALQRTGSADSTDSSHYRRSSLPTISHESLQAVHRRLATQLPPRNPNNQKINLTAPHSVMSTSPAINTYRLNNATSSILSNSGEFSSQHSDVSTDSAYHTRSFSTDKLDDYQQYSKSHSIDSTTDYDKQRHLYNGSDKSISECTTPTIDQQHLHGRAPFMDQLMYSVKSLLPRSRPTSGTTTNKSSPTKVYPKTDALQLHTDSYFVKPVVNDIHTKHSNTLLSNADIQQAASYAFE